MKHLTPDELSRLMDGELEGRALEKAESHLGECATCREALAALEAQDQALKPMLTHNPGAAYFVTFPERVQQRIRESAAVPADVPDAARPGWFSGPRRLAWAGGVLAVLVAAGVVFLTARDSGVPGLRNPELMRGQPVPPPTAASRPTGEAGEAKREASARAPESQPAPVTAPPQAIAPDATPGPAMNATEAPAAGDAERAAASAPARARRVRQDARGEDVPARVRDEARSRFAQPPAPAPAAGTLQKPAPQPLAPKARATVERDTRGLQGKEGAAAPGLLPEALQSQSETVGARLCGVIKDRTGRPVVGARVTLADLGLTTTADETGHYCLDAPGGDHTLSVMALGFEPVRRGVSIGGAPMQADVTLEPVAVLEGPSLVRGSARAMLLDRSTVDLATWPSAAREVARQAQQKTEQAARNRSASQFDDAAELWNRALERARGTSAEIEARARLAESRYRAWQLAPTARRRIAALEDLTSYLVRAPMGAARDSAVKRLDRMKQ